MSTLAWLVPLALGMGLVALLAFLWSVKSGQWEDLDGAAPLPDPEQPSPKRR